MKLETIAKILLLSSITLTINAADDIKRVRNEGTFFIPASNVMSNGNISAFIGSGISVTEKRITSSSPIGLAIGLAEIMQISANVSFTDFQKLGTTEAHLQLTTPGNNRLRFFGFAISGDLYLSSSLDTLSKTADSTKPEFKPYILATAIMDLDFITRSRQLPIKTYLKFSLADNPELLFEYSQLSFKYGLEWKMSQHSLFVEAAAGLYKEKYPPEGTKAEYDQYQLCINPGGRYRFKKRFSLIGTLGFSILKEFKERGSFEPSLFNFHLKFEAPIIYKESETEAIRSLIFNEKKRSLAKEEEGIRNTSGTDISGKRKVTTILEDLEDDNESFDFRNENEELIRRREQVQQKMDSIEELLKEDDE